MSLEQGMPQVSGPMVDRNGIVTQAWWAFFRTLFERTGGSEGDNTGDLALIGALNGSGGPSSDPAATGLAQAAFLAAATPKLSGPVDYTQPELFALLLLSGRSGGSSVLSAQDEGVSVSTGVMVLNFTGGGVTASLTSPGVVEIAVPAGGGGTVTSVATDATLSGGPITTTGTLSVVSAPKWTTARTLTLGTDLTGSIAFDGSANFTLNATLANTAVTPGTYGDATHVAQVTFDAKGRATGVVNVPITGATSLSCVPLSMGTEPLTFVSDGSGQPILVPYTP